MFRSIRIVASGPDFIISCFAGILKIDSLSAFAPTKEAYVSRENCGAEDISRPTG